jgi:hypothetical protein
LQAQYLPLNNDYLIGKSVNVFASGSALSFVMDAVQLIGGDCTRPYNGKQIMYQKMNFAPVILELKDTAVHVGFFQASTIADLSVYYSQSIEMDLGICSLRELSL